MQLEIIYEDDDILVCRKPAGVATQTKRLGQQDMESLLKNYRVRKGEPPYIGVVHRLDQPVEGLIVFAKNQKAAASLSKQVRERIIGKHYYALVACGEEIPVTESWTTLLDAMICDRKTNISCIVPEGTPGAQKAVLEYRVVWVRGGRALVDILLHTGRHHQIRLQFSHMGWPLVGDRKYNGQTPDAGSKPESLALCSYRLEFTHPSTGKRMDFSVEPSFLAESE